MSLAGQEARLAMGNSPGMRLAHGDGHGRVRLAVPEQAGAW